MEGRHHQADELRGSECHLQLCKRIAANPEFIPEPLRPYFFGARLIPIAKNNGGVRPIAIGTIFHKLISSAVMCNLKEKLPGFFSPVQFGVGIPQEEQRM